MKNRKNAVSKFRFALLTAICAISVTSAAVLSQAVFRADDDQATDAVFSEQNVGETVDLTDAIAEMEKQLAANGLDKEIKVIKTGCFGLCALGPIMVVYPEGAFYSRVKVEDVKEIVEEHLLKGRIVKRLLYHVPQDNP